MLGFGLNVQLVFRSALNIVQLFTAAAVVTVVQHCFCGILLVVSPPSRKPSKKRPPRCSASIQARPSTSASQVGDAGGPINAPVLQPAHMAMVCRLTPRRPFSHRRTFLTAGAH